MLKLWEVLVRYANLCEHAGFVGLAACEVAGAHWALLAINIGLLLFGAIALYCEFREGGA